MKNLSFLVLLLIFTSGYAQKTDSTSVSQQKINELRAQRKTITEQEKEKLKQRVNSIHEQVDAGKISEAKAIQLKESAAKQHALNIENQLDMIDLNIELIQRNETDSIAKNPYVDVGAILTDTKRMTALDSIPGTTYGGPYLGFGMSTMTGENSGDYKIGVSGIFGIRLTSVFSRKKPEYRLSYGVEMHLDALPIKNDKLFVKDGVETNLADVDLPIKKSSFTMSNLIFPVHFEYGPMSISYRNNKASYAEWEHWNVGLGGFAGFRLTRPTQGYSYDDNGESIFVAVSRDFNTSDFVYGISAYAGYGALKINVKYFANQVFNHSNANGNVLSIGLLLGY